MHRAQKNKHTKHHEILSFSYKRRRDPRRDLSQKKRIRNEKKKATVTDRLTQSLLCVYKYSIRCIFGTFLTDDKTDSGNLKKVVFRRNVRQGTFSLNNTSIVPAAEIVRERNKKTAVVEARYRRFCTFGQFNDFALCAADTEDVHERGLAAFPILA